MNESILDKLKRKVASYVEKEDNTPRGIRNNNPGNIDYQPSNKWQGQLGREITPSGKKGRFARFSRPEYGIRAMTKLLKNYKKNYGIDTLPEIVNKYAPPHENQVEPYIRSLEKSTGISRDEKIDYNDMDKTAKLVKGIIQHENGQQPYTDEQIYKGVEMSTKSGVFVPDKMKEDTPKMDINEDNQFLQSIRNRIKNEA